jgi:branched-chain amino acid transport system ATP-binding protein
MSQEQRDKPILQVEQVSVRFGGVVALDKVTFDVRRGEIRGLIGPNGAGKSTLFNCLSRLYHCDHGHIRLNGDLLTDLPRHRIASKGVGRTFQNLAMFQTLSVESNIMIGAHSRSRSGFAVSALGLGSVEAEEATLRTRARTAYSSTERARGSTTRPPPPSRPRPSAVPSGRTRRSSNRSGWG